MTEIKRQALGAVVLALVMAAALIFACADDAHASTGISQDAVFYGGAVLMWIGLVAACAVTIGSRRVW